MGKSGKSPNATSPSSLKQKDTSCSELSKKGKKQLKKEKNKRKKSKSIKVQRKSKHEMSLRKQSTLQSLATHATHDVKVSKPHKSPFNKSEPHHAMYAHQTSDDGAKKRKRKRKPRKSEYTLTAKDLIINSDNPNESKWKTKKKKKRVVFVHKLPKLPGVALILRDIPWFPTKAHIPLQNHPLVAKQRTKIGKNNNNAAKTTPYNKTSEFYQHLDKELHSFNEYVKLTSVEISMRNHYIYNILSKSCRELFGPMRLKKLPQNAAKAAFDVEKEIRVTPYGSFATQDVCTYLSDVDVVIWGALNPVEVERASYKKKGIEQQTQNSGIDQTKAATSLEKWRQVLLDGDDIAAAANVKIKDETNTVIDIDDPTIKKIVNGVNDVKVDAIPARKQSKDGLFFIDLTGDSHENKSSDVADAVTSSDATSATTASTRMLSVDYSDDDNIVVDDDCENRSYQPQNDENVKNGTTVAHRNSSADQTKDTKRTTKATETNPNSYTTTTAASTTNKPFRSYSDVDEALGEWYNQQQQSKEEYQKSTAAHVKALGVDTGVMQVGFSHTQSVAPMRPKSPSSTSTNTPITITTPTNNNNNHTTPQIFGPTGKLKKLVVKALYPIGRLLTRAKFTTSMEVRRHAKVPIINVQTMLGVEIDIGIGGHNGVDTSAYARRLVKLYKSFSYVVVLLKILLNQSDLDKPYTGGLGSYKLYVLVAHHIECHLKSGKKDRPSEILMAFFYRYADHGGGGDDSFEDNHTLNTTAIPKIITATNTPITDLTQNINVASHDGVAELKAVFKLHHVTRLFRLTYERLIRHLHDTAKNDVVLADNDEQRNCGSTPGETPVKEEVNEPDNDGDRNQQKATTTSLLGLIIDHKVLRSERQDAISKSKSASKSVNDNKIISASSIPRRRYAELGPAHTVYKPSFPPPQARAANDEELNTDDEADKLAAGYGMKRSPRGALIPLNRPDLEAKRAMQELDPENVLGRGTKRRKNKKKQMRDKALEGFAVQELAHATRAETFSHRRLPQPPAHKAQVVEIDESLFRSSEEEENVNGKNSDNNDSLDSIFQSSEIDEDEKLRKKGSTNNDTDGGSSNDDSMFRSSSSDVDIDESLFN